MIALLLVTLALGKKSLHPATLFGRDARIALDVIEGKSSAKDALFLSSEFADVFKDKEARGMEPSLPGFSRHARTGANCVQDDQCYAGNDAANDCCTGKTYRDIVGCTDLNYCNLCSNVAEYLVRMGITSGACNTLGVVGLCIPSIVGGPLVAACAFLVPKICSQVAGALLEYADGLGDPSEDYLNDVVNQACLSLDMCHDDAHPDQHTIQLGQSCGCVQSWSEDMGATDLGESCAESVEQCCSGREKSFFHSFPCVAMGMVKCD